MPLENRSIVLRGLESVAPTASLVRAEVRDGIGLITEIDIEFILTAAEDGLPAEPMDREAALGLTLSVSVEMDSAGMALAALIASDDGAADDTAATPKRWFSGVCIEICRQDDYGRSPFYFASLRAWPWFLTQRTDCRIFQDCSARAIIETVCRELGFTDRVEFKLLSDDVQPLPERAFRVQYRESAYDFLYRLMADDGLSFFMRHEEGLQTMVVFNDPSRLPFAPGTDVRTDDATIRFIWFSQLTGNETSVLYEFHRTSRFWSGRVALGDYDPESADNRLEAQLGSAVSPMGDELYAVYETYDYPGRFVRRHGQADRDHFGEHLASLHLHRVKSGARLDRAAGNTRRIACGQKFRIDTSAVPDLAPNAGTSPYHVALRAVHRLQIDAEGAEGDLRNSLLVRRASLPPLTLSADLAEGEAFERYRVDLDLVRAGEDDEVEHVPLPEPKRPVIPGLQTATVVGPQGSRVHTDEFGRVKVRFHWDRHAPDDERTSCWVRTVMPWAGNQYGAVMMPRVGQEVVVQFEEGDPDRPIVAGMLYNSVNRPPLTAIDPNTSVGIVSQSLSGDQRSLSMLVFDDTAGAEQVSIHAHRDFRQTVNNDMEVEIDGALTIEIDDRTDIDVGKKMTLKVKTLEIESKEEIKISVGGSSIKITDSAIVLKADKIKNNP